MVSSFPPPAQRQQLQTWSTHSAGEGACVDEPLLGGSSNECKLCFLFKNKTNTMLKMHGSQASPYPRRPVGHPLQTFHLPSSVCLLDLYLVSPPSVPSSQPIIASCPGHRILPSWRRVACPPSDAPLPSSFPSKMRDWRWFIGH